MKKVIILSVLSFISLGAFVPNDFKDQIIEKLETYSETDYPEKAYVQTDKSYYLMDDTIWFTGYLVNGISHKKSSKSRVLHVELINEQDSIVDHKRLYIDKISEAGDIEISQKWNPGKYLLRAYTNDMRNNSEEYFFKKDIWIWSSQKFVESNDSAYSTINENKELARPSLNFYPEGGNLIQGVSNKVALKFSYNDYDIEDFAGIVYDGEGNKVSNFKIYKDGLGLLALTPEKGKRYYASININGGEEHYQLPKAQTNGFSIGAVNNGDNILIHLSSTYETGLKGTFLVAHQRGKIVFQKFEKNINSKYSINLETNQFSDGVLHVTLFDSFGNPVSERLLFVQNPENKINLNIEKNNKVLSTRQKLTLNLNVFDYQGIQTSGDFSMTVRDAKASTHINGVKNIKTWLLLNSDVRGRIDNPGYYFESGDGMKKRFLLDLVMLTNGWRRFTWNELLHEPQTGKKFDTELGIFIAGRTVDLKSSLEPHSSETRLTFVDKVPHQEVQQSNEEGNFKFGPYVFFDSIPTLIEARKTNFNSKSQRDRKVLILLDDNIETPVIHPRQNSAGNNSEMDFKAMIGVTNYLEKLKWEYGENVKELDEVVVRAKIKTDADKRNEEMNKRTRYGSPSDRIVTDNAVGPEMRNILDLLRSKAGIQVNGNSVSIRGGGSASFYLDGVEVDSTFVQFISGNEIAFIDILKGPEANVFANSGNGVIAMYSNDGISNNYTNVKRSPGIIDFRAKGFYVAKEFYAPDHINGMEEQVKSDYRTTLHWEPEIRLSNDSNMEISFFTSDLKEAYIIEIEGITDSGIPVHTSSTFLVN